MNKFLSKYRIQIGFVFAILFIFAASPDIMGMTVGLPIGIIGLMIRLWASGHIKKNKQLSVDGPYSYTRNPLYLGSFFIGLGVSIMGSSAIFIIIYLAGFYFVYYNVIKGEEKMLIELFGAEFLDYKTKVPIFFPKLKPVRLTKDFDIKLVIKHEEYNAWLGFIFVTIILYLKYHFKFFYGCPL
ncbi:MAG: isoprenylcysteine carboxylmethyltransferase family protein [Deltaproteobacteria bacterium]|nr:isoprenylcysteine carboxylmethyltransferase family protein [Deltaproteobacteria bacterium]